MAPVVLVAALTVATDPEAVRAAVLPHAVALPWREALMLSAPFVGTLILRRRSKR